MIKILIPEDIPSQNKGEAALFYGMIESLKILEPYKINLFSLNPLKDSANYGTLAKIVDSRNIAPKHILDSLSATTQQKLYGYASFLMKHLLFLGLYKVLGSKTLKVFKKDLWRAYHECDLVIMNHDSFFSPFYHCPLHFFFHFLHKPTVIYAATIKPPYSGKSKLKAAIYQQLIGASLKKVTLITLRERFSFEYLRALGVTENKTIVKIYPDLAFLLPSASKERINEIWVKEGIDKLGKPFVGIAISQRKLEFAYPNLKSIRERRERALESIVHVVDYITDVVGASILFIPHAIGPSRQRDDRIMARKIYERVKNKDKIKIIEKEYTSQELKGLAGRLDLTVGTRLHFTIDAMCMKVPSVLITHKEDIRCHGIIGEMLGQSGYLYNIEAIDHNSLISKVESAWNNQQAIKEDLELKVSSIKEEAKLNGIKVAEIFNSWK